MTGRLVLGSASPRRAALLGELGLDFVVHASDVPEVPEQGESARAFSRRAAADKARAVKQERDGDWVLAADTVVVIGEEILGKPRDGADARRMLRKLSGRTHRVITAVALAAPGGELEDELSVESLVEFRILADEEIDAYVATGEPLDKAGAYAIQGGARGFVTAVSGSYSSIIGLPLEEVRALLERHGLLGAAGRLAPSEPPSGGARN